MTNLDVEVPETTVVSKQAIPQPKQNTISNRATEKRAEAVRAKKKKKRAAHRVALRRSNTGG